MAYAGEQINVSIGPVAAANNGTPIGLVMVGTYGPKVYNTVFESGMAQFVIPSQDTLQPGYLALIAAADEARGEASIILFSSRSASASESYNITEVTPDETQEGVAGYSTPHESID